LYYHLYIKTKFFILLSLFSFLTAIIITQPHWPALFSFQSQIDPKTLTESFDPNPPLAYFNNQSLIAPSFLPQVLGDSDTPSLNNKHIEVDLTNQRLYAFENNQKVFDFLISSGTWNRTPTGTFYIWTKIRSQKMSGGSKELGTYYYLPNVPYIMFFYNDKVEKKTGYSLHGTYWHDNFGVPMSHGCVNMKTPEVAQVFSWAEVGTPIVIYGKYEYQK